MELDQWLSIDSADSTALAVISLAWADSKKVVISCGQSRKKQHQLELPEAEAVKSPSLQLMEVPIDLVAEAASSALKKGEEEQGVVPNGSYVNRLGQRGTVACSQ